MQHRGQIPLESCKAPIRRRATALGVAEAQAVRKLVAPYLRNLPAWQSRLAYLRAIRRGARTPPETFAVATIELGELLATIQQAYDRFTAATCHAVTSSRVIDGSAAYVRLLEHLQTELSMERPYLDEVLIIPPAFAIPLLAKHQIRD